MWGMAVLDKKWYAYNFILIKALGKYWWLHMCECMHVYICICVYDLQKYT